MNVYLINLRFDLDDERERMAAEYLQQFPQRGKTTRNRFAVDALCAYISRIVGIYASKSQVERYLSPVSGSKATMRLPANSDFWASSNAA